MRAIWKGSISFGLVVIPVKLYPGTIDVSLDLDLLHKKDKSPIRYARICKADGREIPYEDTVKGYEYEKGDYVILTDEDFERANAAQTKTIEIQRFGHLRDIDPVYFEKSYYLEPDSGAEKAYALLRDALDQSNVVALATFVFRNREHVGIVRVKDNALLLTQLRWHSEIRPVDISKPATRVSRSEMEMALALIDQMTGKLHPEDYEDTYTDELKRVIKEKVSGKTPRRKGKTPIPTRGKDLEELLRKSLKSPRKHDVRKARA
ncbi:MAG TPA: Ku protein [Candidatus Peribacteraceae bacterium]|nr:Ku protein [Candidatus Peribacteraceae bacterium]